MDKTAIIAGNLYKKIQGIFITRYTTMSETEFAYSLGTMSALAGLSGKQEEHEKFLDTLILFEQKGYIS